MSDKFLFLPELTLGPLDPEPDVIDPDHLLAFPRQGSTSAAGRTYTPPPGGVRACQDLHVMGGGVTNFISDTAL